MSNLSSLYSAKRRRKARYNVGLCTSCPNKRRKGLVACQSCQDRSTRNRIKRETKMLRSEQVSK